MPSQRDEVRRMEYPARGGAPAPVIDLERPADLAAHVRELEARLAEKERQFARRLESARREALEQGKQQAGSAEAAWREQCAGQLGSAVHEFRVHRDDYLARVEQEVVRLALAMAERILHREAELDPMLLSGAVRVALGQLAASTEVRLRVPAGEREMWAEMVRLMPGLPLRPEVRADERLGTGEVVLEGSLGAVDLGVRAQLGEIERSFFDGPEGAGTTQGGAASPAAGPGKRG